MGSMITRFMSAQRTTALPAFAAVLVAAFMAALIAALAIASAASASEGCPNETIRTNQANYLGLKQPGELLPDCRAYELVTPADLNGDGVEYVLGTRPDGEALAYRTVQAFGEVQSNITGLSLATRTSDGWAASSLNPATLGRPGEAYDEPYALAFSANLSEWLVGSPYPFSSQDTGSYKGASEPGSSDLYLREADGAMTWVSHGETLPDPSEIARGFGGSSADLKRVFFETRRAETKAVFEANQREVAPTTLEEEATKLEEEAKKLEAEGYGYSAERKREEAAEKRGEADGELGRHDIYEWHEGHLALVNLDSEGKLIPGGADVGRTNGVCGCYNSNEPYNGGLHEQGHALDRTAVSQDGRVAFFTAPVEPVEGKRLPFQLYVRVDGEGTLQASRCRAAACEVEGKRGGAPHGAEFLIASPDGATVLFYSSDQLTEGAPAGGGIYSYQAASDTLSFLTPLTMKVYGDESGLLAASEDLSYLYLCDEGGAVSLYHNGTVTPVATVHCNASKASYGRETEPVDSRYLEDEPPGMPRQGEPLYTPASGYLFATTAGPQDVAKGEKEIEAGKKRLEEDKKLCEEGKPTWDPSFYCEGGRPVLYAEQQIKSGERTIEEGKEFSAYENEGHSEVYLYDPATKTLSCLSCRPGGEPAQGDSYLNANPAAPNRIEVPEAAGVEVRNLAEDGGTAFFVSEDALVPGDVNKAFDVYEWEHAGVGGCTTNTASETDKYSPASGGCVALISSGAEGATAGAAFEGSSENGSNVFVATYRSLAPQDSGSELMVYDARVDGGFPPALGEVGSAGPCESTEACRSPLSEPPVQALGASAAFSGPGNLTPPREEKKVGPAKKRKLTRTQKLKSALKRCNVKFGRNKRMRGLCKRRARKRLSLHEHRGIAIDTTGRRTRVGAGTPHTGAQRRGR